MTFIFWTMQSVLRSKPSTGHTKVDNETRIFPNLLPERLNNYHESTVAVGNIKNIANVKINNFFFFLILCFAAFAQNNPLPAWEKGYLDIHFINTGRGDAAFIVMPDGSSLLVDAGDLDRDAESMVA